MAINLYSKKECPFCWQVKIAMAYFELAYDMTEWGKPVKEKVLKISPQGSLPVVIHDDLVLWDSLPAMYYFEDISRPNQTLFPGTNHVRAKARLLHSYGNSVVGKGLREVIFAKRDTDVSDWDLERIYKGTSLWQENLAWLESEVESEEHFLSAGFSIADVALLPRFGLAEFYDVGVTEAHPKLFKWFINSKTKNIYQDTLPWQ